MYMLLMRKKNLSDLLQKFLDRIGVKSLMSLFTLMGLLMITSLMRETETLSKHINQIRNLNLNKMNYPLIFLKRDKRNLDKRDRKNEGECYFECIEHAYKTPHDLNLMAPSNATSSHIYSKLDSQEYINNSNDFTEKAKYDDTLDFYKFIPSQNDENNFYNNKSNILLVRKYNGNIETDLKKKILKYPKVNYHYNHTLPDSDLYNVELNITPEVKFLINETEGSNGIRYGSSGLYINTTERSKNKYRKNEYSPSPPSYIFTTFRYFFTEINKTDIKNKLIYNESENKIIAPSFAPYTKQMPIIQTPTMARMQTTRMPTTLMQATLMHTASMPTTLMQTTRIPTTLMQTTRMPITLMQTTRMPTTLMQTASMPTTLVQTARMPTTLMQSARMQTTRMPTARMPTTIMETARMPTTLMQTAHMPKTLMQTAHMQITKMQTSPMQTTQKPTTIKQMAYTQANSSTPYFLFVSYAKQSDTVTNFTPYTHNTTNEIRYNLTFNINPTIRISNKDYYDDDFDKNKTKKNNSTPSSKFYFLNDYDRSTESFLKLNFLFTPLSIMFPGINKSEIKHKIMYNSQLDKKINKGDRFDTDSSNKTRSNTLGYPLTEINEINPNCFMKKYFINSVPSNDSNDLNNKLKFKINFANNENDEVTPSFKMRDSVNDKVKCENDLYKYQTLKNRFVNNNELGILNQINNVHKDTTDLNYINETFRNNLNVKDGIDYKNQMRYLMPKFNEITTTNNEINGINLFDLNIIDRPFNERNKVDYKSQMKSSQPNFNEFITNNVYINGTDVNDLKIMTSTLKSLSNVSNEFDDENRMTNYPLNLNKCITTLTAKNINDTDVNDLKIMTSTLKSLSNVSNEFYDENRMTNYPLNLNKCITTLTAKNINDTDVNDLKIMTCTLKSLSAVSNGTNDESISTYNPDFNDIVINNDDNDDNAIDSTLRSLFTLRDDPDEHNPITYNPPNINEINYLNIMNLKNMFNASDGIDDYNQIKCYVPKFKKFKSKEDVDNINYSNVMDSILSNLFKKSNEIDYNNQIKYDISNFNKFMSKDDDKNVMDHTLKNLLNVSDETYQKALMKHNETNFNDSNITSEDNFCDLNLEISTRNKSFIDVPNNHKIETTTVNYNLNSQKQTSQNKDYRLQNYFTTTTHSPAFTFIPLDDMCISKYFMSNNTNINNLGHRHFCSRRNRNATQNGTLNQSSFLPYYSNQLWPYIVNVSQLQIHKIPIINSCMNPVDSYKINSSEIDKIPLMNQFMNPIDLKSPNESQLFLIDKTPLMKSFMNPVDQSINHSMTKNKYIKPILIESFSPEIVKAMRYIDKSFMNYPAQVLYSPYRSKMNNSNNNDRTKQRKERNGKLENNKVNKLNQLLFI